MVKVKGEDGEVELITPRQANERLRELETKNRAELLKEERADNAKKQQEAAERKEAKQQEEEKLAQEERTTMATMAARKAVKLTASSSVLCPSSSTSSSSSSSSASSASSVSSSSSSSAPPVSSAVAERKSNEEKARLTDQQARFDRIKSSFEENPNTKVTKADLDFLNKNFNHWDALFAEAKALREAISEQYKKTWIIDSDSEDSNEIESDRENEVKKAELSPEEKKLFADLTNVYIELKSSFDNDLARKISIREKVKMVKLTNDFGFSDAGALVDAFFKREEKLKKEAKLKKNL
jgi:multidrug efflux pump subunit AcrA (membrane-fusion protein)